MGLSTIERVGDGSPGSNVIQLSFPYLYKTDIRVTVDGYARGPETLTWLTGSSFRLPDTPAYLTGKTIRAQRVTPIDQPEVTFQPAGIDHRDLNRSAAQSLYRLQEAEDVTAAQDARLDAALVAQALRDSGQDQRLAAHDIALSGGIPVSYGEDLPAYPASRFGILPDGADHTAAIAAAVSAIAAAGGGTLLFEPGVFLFPHKVPTLAGKHKVCLRGSGKGVTVFRSTVVPEETGTGDVQFFLFQGCNGIRVEALTFDLNSILTTNANTSAVGALLCDGFEFRHNEVINGKRVGVFLNGTTNYRIESNVFRKAGSPEGSYQNEAIISSHSAGDTYGGFISGSVAQGWGFLLSGHHLKIDGNDIASWGYGGGITLEADAATHTNLIIGNTCRGGVGVDVNGYRVGGIENWGPYTRIIGNLIENTSGAAIDQGGQSCLVSGNLLRNNATSLAGPAIAVRYQTPTFNGSWSEFVGNKLVNETGNTTYGLEDQTGSLTAVTVGPNDFRQATTGPLRLLGSGYAVSLRRCSSMREREPPQSRPVGTPSCSPARWRAPTWVTSSRSPPASTCKAAS